MPMLIFDAFQFSNLLFLEKGSAMWRNLYSWLLSPGTTLPRFNIPGPRPRIRLLYQVEEANFISARKNSTRSEYNRRLSTKISPESYRDQGEVREDLHGTLARD